MNKLFLGVTVISIVICVAIRWYWKHSFDVERHVKAYAMVENRIHEKRLVYEMDWNKNPSKHTVLQNMAKRYLYETLTDSIFDYWYGTTWDFNGVTQQPRKGKIACGYFVTTTLEDVGFILPRVKMAQQAASIIIRSLCPKESIKAFNQIAHLKQHMDKQKEGLYILGLDTHVGFLWKSANNLHFVHASYSGNKQVSKELWNESIVMQKSKLFVVGNLLDNPKLMQQWIRGIAIPVSK